ncbi:hypothetical protein AAE478_003989 [Parahypoxylon ruwenzoriense]
MADQHNERLVTGGLEAKDISIRTQTIIWPASTLVTTWTLGSDPDPTGSLNTIAPVSNSDASTDQNVGPILSGVVGFLVLILVTWLCCRQNRFGGRRSRRSSRRQGSSYMSKGVARSSMISSGESNRGASLRSSEMAEDQWDHPEPMPQGPMPGMPRPVAGGWPAPQPASGVGGPPPGPGIGFAPGQGGPPPMMGRGGPLMGKGASLPMMGRGGPPHGGMQ